MEDSDMEHVTQQANHMTPPSLRMPHLALLLCSFFYGFHEHPASSWLIIFFSNRSSIEKNSCVILSKANSPLLHADFP